MTFAAEILASLGLRLAGDLIVCTVTDEESTGIGGLAAVAHGVRADAGIVTEPSGLDAWVACRGSLMPTITVPGRPGHAGVGQPHWREGGAVNAIEKAQIVMDALRRFEEDWRARPDHHHPHLSPGDVVPTVISGGEWMVSYPSSCRIVYHVAYLPVHADEERLGHEGGARDRRMAGARRSGRRLARREPAHARVGSRGAFLRGASGPPDRRDGAWLPAPMSEGPAG